MQGYQLLEVGQNPARVRQFLAVVTRIYPVEQFPHYIAPLRQDIEKVFDKAANKYFLKGDCIRWIILDAAGICLGRIAAFYVHQADQAAPAGGMGFFEVTPDPIAADLLLNTAQNWLQSMGCTFMDGPINFGDRDRFWGLLTEGYDQPPNYGMFYHPPYYREYLEAFGFRCYYRQFTYARSLLTRVPEVFYAKAKRIQDDPNYRFQFLDLSQIDKQTEDFRTIYNAAWGKHDGVAAMTALQAKTIMKSLKPVINPRLIIFGYYRDEPIAMFVCLPELNYYFRAVPNANFNLLGKLVFLLKKTFFKPLKTFGLVFGVVPEFQGRGVESAMIIKMSEQALNGYPMGASIEMNWIGDFNPKMIKVCEYLGATVSKTHATYRKLFDPAAEWTPMSVIQ